jgi:hypothetical protein
MSEEIQEKPKSRRGFASMDPEKRQQIASLGGRAVPAENRSFSKNRELAVSAGRKGGMRGKKP